MHNINNVKQNIICNLRTLVESPNKVQEKHLDNCKHNVRDSNVLIYQEQTKSKRGRYQCIILCKMSSVDKYYENNTLSYSI